MVCESTILPKFKLLRDNTVTHTVKHSSVGYILMNITSCSKNSVIEFEHKASHVDTMLESVDHSIFPKA